MHAPRGPTYYTNHTDGPAGRPTDRRQHHGRRTALRHLASRWRVGAGASSAGHDGRDGPLLPLLRHYWPLLPTSTAVPAACRAAHAVHTYSPRTEYMQCNRTSIRLHQQPGEPNRSTNGSQHRTATSTVITICISRPPESQLVACTEHQARHCVPPSSSHGVSTHYYSVQNDSNHSDTNSHHLSGVSALNGGLGQERKKKQHLAWRSAAGQPVQRSPIKKATDRGAGR